MLRRQHEEYYERRKEVEGNWLCVREKCLSGLAVNYLTPDTEATAVVDMIVMREEEASGSTHCVQWLNRGEKRDKTRDKTREEMRGKQGKRTETGRQVTLCFFKSRCCCPLSWPDVSFTETKSRRKWHLFHVQCPSWGSWLSSHSTFVLDIMTFLRIRFVVCFLKRNMSFSNSSLPSIPFVIVRRRRILYNHHHHHRHLRFLRTLSHLQCFMCKILVCSGQWTLRAGKTLMQT